LVVGKKRETVTGQPSRGGASSHGNDEAHWSQEVLRGIGPAAKAMVRHVGREGGSAGAGGEEGAAGSHWELRAPPMLALP